MPQSDPDPTREALLAAMREVFQGDRRRIDHALAVLEHAEAILAVERNASPEVVQAAAILHDVGIPEAERRYGSAAGKYQEQLGPPIAERILRELGQPEALVDHVSRIIANHHSARAIDTPEFRIIWDADWLVNLAAHPATAHPDKLVLLIARTFKTPAGLQRAKALYLG